MALAQRSWDGHNFPMCLYATLLSVALLRYKYASYCRLSRLFLLSQCSFWKSIQNIMELYQTFCLVFNSRILNSSFLEKQYPPYLFVNSYHVSKGIPANSHQPWQTYLVDLCSDFDGCTDLFVLFSTKLITLWWHPLKHWTSKTLLIY